MGILTPQDFARPRMSAREQEQMLHNLIQSHNNLAQNLNVAFALISMLQRQIIGLAMEQELTPETLIDSYNKDPETTKLFAQEMAEKEKEKYGQPGEKRNDTAEDAPAPEEDFATASGPGGPVPSSDDGFGSEVERA